VKRKASFTDKCGASELGLIALIPARDAHSDIFSVEEKHVIGWGRRMLIKHKLALKMPFLAEYEPVKYEYWPPPIIIP
jgi:hypothetical protein